MFKINILRVSFAIATLFTALALHSQNAIPIPDTLSGSNIDLTMQTGTRAFFPGFQTATLGYNGAYLGPTIILQKGQTVNFQVHNHLGDTSTTHWHGMHVAPHNGGGPHTPIMDGET